MWGVVRVQVRVYVSCSNDIATDVKLLEINGLMEEASENRKGYRTRDHEIQANKLQVVRKRVDSPSVKP